MCAGLFSSQRRFLAHPEHDFVWITGNEHLPCQNNWSTWQVGFIQILTGMIVAQVGFRMTKIKDQTKMCSLILKYIHVAPRIGHRMSGVQRCGTFSGVENGEVMGTWKGKPARIWSTQQGSGVISIGLMQVDTIPSHRDNQVIGCGLFQGICKDWNMLSFTLIQNIPNMLSGGLLGSM